jgi:hypothetical protein
MKTKRHCKSCDARTEQTKTYNHLDEAVLVCGNCYAETKAPVRRLTKAMVEIDMQLREMGIAI